MLFALHLSCTDVAPVARGQRKTRTEGPKVSPPVQHEKKGELKHRQLVWQVMDGPPGPPFPWKAACLFKVVFIHLIPEIKNWGILQETLENGGGFSIFQGNKWWMESWHLGGYIEEALTAHNAMPQDIAYGAPRESWNETREAG